MHIREPRDFAKVQAKRRARGRLKKIRRLLYLLAACMIGLCLVAYGAYLRPLPNLTAKMVLPSVPTDQVALTWPTKGQAAIGTVDQGVLASTAGQQPVPTASVAKVMTALAVLKKHPLQSGQDGPTLTMTNADVAIYNSYIGQDGSVVKVEVGEQLTERQALQAALLPSSNNLADSLAVWAYGSMADYLVVANQLAQSLGMTQSKFAGDASGFLPETTSTPHDLVLLGQAALKNPALKQIVAQKSATLPVVGTVSNVNSLLGNGGVIGVKTGNSEQAGGCFMFAAERALPNGQTVTVVGAVAGSPSLGQAMASTLPLLDSFYQGFTTTVVVPKGTIVAHYVVPWDGLTINAVTAQDTSLLNWRGSKTTVKVSPATMVANRISGSPSGSLMAQSDYAKTVTPLVLSTGTGQPSWHWRIFRR